MPLRPPHSPRSARTPAGLVFILSVCGVVISVIIIAGATLGIFIAFGFWDAPTIPNILTSMLFGTVISTTDAHEFLVHALQKAGAPDYVSGVMVGEGLTNDALAAVIFSIVKALYDNYLGCRALTQQTCIGASQCVWETAHGGECDEEPGETLDIWAEIAKDIFGGIAIGLLTAWVFSAVMRRIKRPNTNVLLSITMVLDITMMANRMNSSPAVACAAAGLLMRAFVLPKLERRSQIELDSMWSFMSESLNGVFFLLIGLAIITNDFNISVFFVSIISIPIALLARYLSVAIPVR